MDNHPIPQDVTGFQFKLIGNMTIKQFAYVGGGLIVGVVFYYIPLFILLKLPIITFSALFGVSLAFLPIDGRPLDQMVSRFFKALMSPNQYIFHKVGGTLSFLSIKSAPVVVAAAGTGGYNPDATHTSQEIQIEKQAELTALLYSLPHKPQNKLDLEEQAFMQRVMGTTQGAPSSTPPLPAQATVASPVQQNPLAGALPPIQTPVPVASPTPPPAAVPMPTVPPVQQPPPTPEQQEAALVQEEKIVEEELKTAQQNESQQQTPGALQTAHAQTEAYRQHLEEILQQKQKLEEELQVLQQKIDAQTPQDTTSKPEQPVPVAPQTTPFVREIPQAQTASVGIPSMSDTPNVLTGIIKDSRGNVLSNILVEVKDTGGNPVRAFKTNPLGQFASATALGNGTYTVTFEDPKNVHQFDTISVVAKGEILLPLEVISHDAREALRKELFS